MNLLWLVVAANSLLLVLLVVAMAGVLRYLSAVQARLESSVRRVSKLERGEMFPDIQLPQAGNGRMLSISSVVAGGQRTMVLLLNDTCQSCDVLVRQVAELSTRPGGLEEIRWKFILAWIGDEATVADKAAGLPQTGQIAQLIDSTGKLARQLLIGTFPVGIALDAGGKVVSQSAQPGPNWLYLTLGVVAPEQPLDLGRTPRAVLGMG